MFRDQMNIAPYNKASMKAPKKFRTWSIPNNMAITTQTAICSKFKIFCADTGIFVTLAFWDKDHTENIIYQKLLNDKLSTNLGYVYENMIAQVLTASGNKLFYYTWPKDETHYYEIDFLLSRGSKLYPIEVKSSGYKTHASLDAFCSDILFENSILWVQSFPHF